MISLICFVICVSSIALSVGLGLFMIWGEIESKIAYKAFTSLALIFGGGLATLIVNSFMR